MSSDQGGYSCMSDKQDIDKPLAEIADEVAERAADPAGTTPVDGAVFK